MGNSQSNSINAQINQIMEDSVSTPNVKASETPVITFKKEDKKEEPKVKYVKTETETAAPGLLASSTSPAPVATATNLSATSSVAPSAPVMAATIDSTTSPAPVPNVTLSPTSTEGPKRTSNKKEKPVVRVLVLNHNVFLSSEDKPIVASEAPKMIPTKTGGYSYASEGPSLTGGVNVVHLDSAVFDSEKEGGNNEEKKSSEFNPEKFFQDMQKGGIREPSNKEHKKNRIERYLDPSLDDEDDGFDFAESTEGLDINPNEDTEDIKQKVKALRAMVSRSKGKKSKGRKGSKKTKRMTESSGGASDNSVSTYLDSTSSISTSDVRLISMNKMRK